MPMSSPLAFCKLLGFLVAKFWWLWRRSIVLIMFCIINNAASPEPPDNTVNCKVLEVMTLASTVRTIRLRQPISCRDKSAEALPHGQHDDASRTLHRQSQQKPTARASSMQQQGQQNAAWLSVHCAARISRMSTASASITWHCPQNVAQPERVECNWLAEHNQDNTTSPEPP